MTTGCSNAQHAGGLSMNKTQGTTPADPRLNEWAKLANAAIAVEKEYHSGDLATQERLDSGPREATHEALSDIAADAIPQLIAMVRERDAQLLDRDAFSQEYFDRATAAEARVKELEERNNTIAKERDALLRAVHVSLGRQA
jgi:hypothetical protein